MKITQRSLLMVCGVSLFALACGGQVNEGGPGVEILTEEGPVYQGPAAEDPEAQADPAAEARVLTLVNQARAVARTCGTTAYPAAPALSRDARLDRAAAAHSTDMATRNFFSHTGSDGSSPFVRMQRQGYRYANAGENIAAGYSTADAVVAGWLKSAGHCANIMNARYVHIGISLARGGSYGYYWTQDFGRPL